MQAYKKKMKVIVDSNESVEYLQQNGIISIAFGECTIRTGGISTQLRRLSQLESDFPQMVEQRVKEKITPLLEENKELKSQLEEKIEPISEYQSQIGELQSEIEQLKGKREATLKSNTELQNKIRFLETNIQSLQSEKKELVTSLNHKEKSKKIEKKWRFICDRYLTYQRLRNLAKVVSIFTEYPDKEWRQRQVATNEKLMKNMSSPTIIRHLYDARDRGIIHCPVFPGTYKLNLPDFGGMGADMDVLVRYIVGDEIYDIALMQALKKREFKHH